MVDGSRRCHREASRDRYRARMAALDAWRVDEFASSLTSCAANTVASYRRDVASFVDWAERLGLDGPRVVDRTTLRRYLAYLHTRNFAKRSIARAASALRRYFGWLVRTGTVSASS